MSSAEPTSSAVLYMGVVDTREEAQSGLADVFSSPLYSIISFALKSRLSSRQENIKCLSFLLYQKLNKRYIQFKGRHQKMLCQVKSSSGKESITGRGR